MSNVIRVRHTVNANQRLRQAHELMGMTNRFAAELEPVFNHWSKARISDKDLKTLIQLAMAPNGQVLGDIKASKNENLSTQFINMVESVYEYGLGSETQNMATTAGTVFGAYNAVTGYFQNVKNYKDEDAKIKSLLMGGTAQLKSQKAFDLCESFAAHGAASFNFN